MATKKTAKKAAAKKAKSTPRKRASAKKASSRKGVKDLSQAHGKNEGNQPITLDQIWGDDGSSKYKTIKEEEYAENLAEMSRTDLHAHASRVGLIPIENSDQLKKRLMVEFRKHVAQYKMPVINAQKSNNLSKEAMKILEEGR